MAWSTCRRRISERGQSQSVVITAQSGLTEAEVTRLVDEAEQNKAEDEDRRSWIDLKNKAEGLVYSTEKTLEEFAEHVDAGDREQLTSALEKTKAAMAGEQAEELKLAIDDLSGVAYQMTEKLYATLGATE